MQFVIADPMDTITRNLIEGLIQHSGPGSTSIYLPTHRGGHEVLMEADRKAYKLALRNLATNLREAGMGKAEAEASLAPAKALYDDAPLWYTMADTLLVFLRDGFMQWYRIPYRLEPHIMIGDMFYLMPLLPLVYMPNTFMILAISKNHVHLYDVDPARVEEVNMAKMVPSELTDVVGKDYKERYLQYRSQRAMQADSTYFGHGEATEDQKLEQEKFLRAIDAGICKLFPAGEVPLLVASVEEQFGEYRKLSKYPLLWDEAIKGNADYSNPNDLAETGRQMLESYYLESTRNKIRRYVKECSFERFDDNAQRIFKAAMAGRVEALFVNNKVDMPGRYDAELDEIVMHATLRPGDTDLLNMLAIEVFSKNGAVYLLPPESMPVDSNILNALYRYVA